jgi:hypothetical protein
LRFEGQKNRSVTRNRPDWSSGMRLSNIL